MKKCILKIVALILCVNVAFLQAPLYAADFLAPTEPAHNQQTVSADVPAKTNSDLVVGASESPNERDYSGGALSSAAAPVATAAAQGMLSDEELGVLFSELEKARAIEQVADAAVKEAAEKEQLAVQDEAIARDANRQASNLASSASATAASKIVIDAIKKAEAAEVKATEVWQKALDAVNKAKAELKFLEDQMEALFINRRTGAVIAFDQLSAASQRLYRSLKSDYLAKEKSIERLEETLEKKLDLKNAAIQKTNSAKIYLDAERDAKAALAITTANLAAKSQLRIDAAANKIEKMTPHEAAKAAVRVIENALIANSRKMGLNTPVLTNVEGYKNSLEKHVKDEELKKKLLAEHNRRLSDQFKVAHSILLRNMPSPIGGITDLKAKAFANLLGQQLGAEYKVHYQFEHQVGPVLFFDVKKISADGLKYEDVLTFRATDGPAGIVVIPNAMHMRRAITGGGENPYPEYHADLSAGVPSPSNIPSEAASTTEPDMTYSIFMGINKLIGNTNGLKTREALLALITSPVHSVERVRAGIAENVIVTLSISGQKYQLRIGSNASYDGVPGVIYWQHWRANVISETYKIAQRKIKYSFMSITPAAGT